MILKRLALAASVALAFTASSATAGTVFWNNTGWTVYDYTTNDLAWCGLSTEDRGNGSATLHTHVALMSNGSVTLIVENNDWNITEEELTGMSLFLYDTSGRDRDAIYDGGVWERADRNSFLVPVEPDFLGNFATNNDMFIFRDMGDGSDDVIVGRVSLNGSGYAVGKLRECVAAADRNLRAKKERERTQPVNPF